MRCAGLTAPGAFAEYAVYPAASIFPISDALSDIEAVLIEPAACAAQMLRRLDVQAGSSVLVLGTGPAGMLIAQMLGVNGGVRVVVAGLGGAKLELAKTLGVGQVVEVEGSLDVLRERFPAGFDVVVEATGNSKVLQDAIGLVARGGSLGVFGVYPSDARITWSPDVIMANQIRIIGSVAEVDRFPVSVGYLDTGKIKSQGIVNKTFRLEQWAECLASMRDPGTVKAAIVFDRD